MGQAPAVSSGSSPPSPAAGGACPLDEAALLHRRPRRPRGSTSTPTSPASTTSPARCRDAHPRRPRRATCSRSGRFTGNTDDYYDPRNSLPARGARPARRHPDHAVGRWPWRSAAASACRWRASACPATSCCATRSTPTVFVDPFHGGRLLDAAGCRGPAPGHGRRRRRRGTRATSTRSTGPAIVARMLANLRAIYQRSDEIDSLRWVLRLRCALPGAPTSDRRSSSASWRPSTARRSN